MHTRIMYINKNVYDIAFFLYASVYKAAHHRKMNHLHLVRMHDESQIYCLERQNAEEGLEIRPAFKER